MVTSKPPRARTSAPTTSITQHLKTHDAAKVFRLGGFFLPLLPLFS